MSTPDTAAAEAAGQVRPVPGGAGPAGLRRSRWRHPGAGRASIMIITSPAPTIR